MLDTTHTTAGQYAICNLLPALDALKRVTPARSKVDILKQVLFTGDGTAIATDLDMQLMYRIPDAPLHVPFCGELKPLLAMCKAADRGGFIELDHSEGALKCTAGGMQGYTGSLPAKDFPPFDPRRFAGEPLIEFSIPANELRALLAFCASAMSSEETRYYLKGVYLHPHKGVLTGVATDGHRLAYKPLAGVLWEGDKPGVIIPDHAVNTMLGMLKPKDTSRVTVGLWERGARFNHGDWRLDTRVVEGSFPDYLRAIPSAPGEHLTVPTAGLSAALKSVLAAVGRAKEPGVRIDADEGKIMCDHEAREYIASLPITGKSEPVCIKINGRYLQQMAAAFTDDGCAIVTMHITSRNDPMRVTAPASDSLMVVMPLRR